MQKIFQISLFVLLLSWTGFGQLITTDQVPVVVKKGFHNKFPNVKRMQWKIKSDKNYEAEFMLKGSEIAVKIDSTGKWIETESAALWSAVPSMVQDTIAKSFKKYKVIEIQTVQWWNKQHVIWEIHLEGTNEIVKTQFDENGAVIYRSTIPKLVMLNKVL
jgi:hypothetical protein